jgi:hypothetical protein
MVGDDLKWCNEDGDACFFGGKKDVYYGALMIKDQTDGTMCTTQIFGDPAAGHNESKMEKFCFVRDDQLSLGDVPLAM